MSETLVPPENRCCTSCGVQLPSDAPEGLCPKCVFAVGMDIQADDQPQEAPAVASPRPARTVAPAPEELAKDFPQLEIVELLGQGGMGIVYKARQPALDRLVALKILSPEISSDPAFAGRFTREAQALAKLNHPNIVTIYDFGQVNGQYYFLMEFVGGVNLRRTIESGNLKPKEALGMVSQICAALQYAHDEGVVHRDIKPENVMLDKKGRVKIADFGLAKLLGRAPADYSLTGSGLVMGTPHYMAPEQMEHPQQVDHRADIYSLGVVFYELLTGELPLGRFAPPSKKVQMDVRLDRVVLRALEKEPDRRYQHVSEVGTEVEAIQLDLAHSFRFNCPYCGRHLRATPTVIGKTHKCPGCRQELQVPEPEKGGAAQGEPGVDVRPDSGVTGRAAPSDRHPIRLRKWLALTVSGLVLIGILAFVIALALRGGLMPAESSIPSITDPSAGAIQSMTGTSATKGTLDPQASVRIELDAPAAEVELRVDNKLIDSAQLTKPVSLSLGDHKLTVTGDYFEPLEPTFTVTEGVNQPIKIEPRQKVGQLRLFEGYSAPVWSVAFSPDGRQVLSGGGGAVKETDDGGLDFLAKGTDHTVRLWDVSSGRKLREFVGHAAAVTVVEFLPDGQHVVSGSWDRTVRMWDIENTREVRRFDDALVSRAAFSRDGQRAVSDCVLSTATDSYFRLWDLKDGKELARLAHKNVLVSLTISPDSRYALSASFDGTLCLWDLEAGNDPHRLAENMAVAATAFSPDSRLAASGGQDGLVRLWDVEKRIQLLGLGGENKLPGLGGHTKSVFCLAFSADGRRLMSGSHDKTVRLWDVQSGRELGRFNGHTMPVTSVAISPDGRRAVSGSFDKTIRLWGLPYGD